MKNKIKGYWQDSFWRHNVIFFSFSMFISVLNYLYYPILGRIMDIRHFGEVQTLLSFINITGIFLAAVQIVVVNLSANQKSDTKDGNDTINQFEQASTIFVLALALLMTIGSVFLKDFFSFESFIPFILLGIVIIISVPLGFRRAYLQGKKKFIPMSISGVIVAAGKLILSAIFVYIGFKTIGAIGGILVAELIALSYSSKVAKKLGFVSISRASLGFNKLAVLKPELKYILSVMTVSLASTLMLSGDILVVKRYFNPDLAGQYAGVSAIANSIYFATASFGGVLLASVGRSYSDDHNIKIGRKSLLSVFIIGAAILLLFSIFPKEIISIMLGDRYIGQAHLLPFISLTIFISSLANISIYFLLALRKKYTPWIVMMAGIVVGMLTVINHNSLERIVLNFLTGAILLIVMIACLGLFNYLKMRDN
jgi:O-antigen/teichoic acid export membrane protein